MIEIEGVSKAYAGSDRKAVDNLNWTVPDGAITGFIGPNGAGKSTSIHMMTGSLQPDSGRILLNGIDIAQDPIKAKLQFGFVPDVPDVFLNLKAIEYLDFICDLYGVASADRARFIETVPQRLEIADALNNQIVSMSHGMRQKVMVMGALIHQPSIWILDEPMAGLDPKSAYELKAMMREHAESGRSVLFSTHVLEVAEKLCDQICIINQGKQIFLGTLEQLKDEHPRESLEDIFLHLTGESQGARVDAADASAENGEDR